MQRKGITDSSGNRIVSTGAVPVFSYYQFWELLGDSGLGADVITTPTLVRMISDFGVFVEDLLVLKVFKSFLFSHIMFFCHSTLLNFTLN